MSLSVALLPALATVGFASVAGYWELASRYSVKEWSRRIPDEDAAGRFQGLLVKADAVAKEEGGELVSAILTATESV